MNKTTPRPTLDSLAGRFARKDPPSSQASIPTTSADPAPAIRSDAALEPEGKAPRRKADPRVQILTRIDPATRKRLKVIAAEQERTIQEICEEAIRDFVARHSK